MEENGAGLRETGRTSFFKKPLSAVLGLLPLKLLHVVRFDGIPDIPPGSHAAEAAIAGPGDLGELVQCVDKKEKFQKRFRQGDHCIMAWENGRVRGYLWFCSNESHIEEMCRYEIKISRGSVYCYDEYVSPEYRKRGIFRELYRVVACWMRENGKDSLLSIISHDNELSRNIHAKMGFRTIKKVLYLKLFGFRFFRELRV